MSRPIEFQRQPDQYRHWSVEYEGPIARLTMDVDEHGGLMGDYALKLNSYDLGVDIELADIVQRMRFEHPEIRSVILSSGKDRVFCAGANIRMLGQATHAHKVNFCKFTNETRNALEAALEESGQLYIAAIRGACAGGGYELALACNYLMLANDGASTVALPEVPLLAVLPGTGGLTRVTDKRKVRRDLADVFCSIEEGVGGQRAVDWKLVDEVVRASELDAEADKKALAFAEQGAPASSESDTGIALTALDRSIADSGSMQYGLLDVAIDRSVGTATLTLKGPTTGAPESVADLHQQGAAAWSLALARELDDAILHLRFNELDVGILIFKSEGRIDRVLEHDAFLLGNAGEDWLSREIMLLWKRVLKRIDLTSRSLVTLVEHGSCFGGFLAELVLACDRSYMMLDEFEDDTRTEASLVLSQSNFGQLPMSNGLSRLETRFLDESDQLQALQARMGERLVADEAKDQGLVTFAYDDIDWFDEIRVFMEERGSFSPDALTGMEANLRFPGPETMETRIFGRLTAWQNWIFQRPNAVGEEGALQRYGTGKRGQFDKRRV